MNDDISQKILGMSVAYNNSEISELLNLSREYVRKVLLDYGILNDTANSTHRSIRAYLSKTGKNKTNKEVAELFNTSPNTVSRIRTEMGIPSFHIIKEKDCEKCKSNPYAKGLCKVHYNKSLRKNK